MEEALGRGSCSPLAIKKAKSEGRTGSQNPLQWRALSDPTSSRRPHFLSDPLSPMRTTGWEARCQCVVLGTTYPNHGRELKTRMSPGSRKLRFVDRICKHHKLKFVMRTEQGVNTKSRIINACIIDMKKFNFKCAISV
jgi:hypothetical protein